MEQSLSSIRGPLYKNYDEALIYNHLSKRFYKCLYKFGVQFTTFWV